MAFVEIRYVLLFKIESRWRWRMTLCGGIACVGRSDHSLRLDKNSRKCRPTKKWLVIGAPNSFGSLLTSLKGREVKYCSTRLKLSEEIPESFFVV